MKNGLVNLISSILDFQHPLLSPDVWDNEQKLLPQHKDKILNKLHNAFRIAGFQYYDKWIRQVKVVGSLTTFTYLSTSDIDIHSVVDLNLFNKLEFNDLLTLDQAQEKLDVIRKYLNEETVDKLTNTEHPIEFYFETQLARAETSYSGEYDIVTEKWIKPSPESESDVDVEETFDYVFRTAEDIIAEIETGTGKIRRRITQIEELQKLIQEWTGEKRLSFKNKLEQKLSEIENEIVKIIGVGKEVIKRRKMYMPFSDRELIFKFLQKFSYILLIRELSKVIEKPPEGIIEEKIPELKRVVEKSV